MKRTNKNDIASNFYDFSDSDEDKATQKPVTGENQEERKDGGSTIPKLNPNRKPKKNPITEEYKKKGLMTFVPSHYIGL